ncbi:putative histidine transporter YuiF (NhaC family) [Peribacillus huizhouensis]|uniref:Histidine transporter YuiF (NhaC family) n=1 Tax=Peribacillus huizhouensis TaxID=1501239 RepID=A0ABR6CVT9_9BACI|nr:putative histidine transporter YuiF (NhaC family) [Peribacillus huizhouensis]
MSRNKNNKWVVYIIFAIIMFLIYKFVPIKYGFISIVIFPLIYWFVYDFFKSKK